ncbi:MAG: class I mannose-6-phosphate isomerase [Muribaculaceae bacterium]|nr:class I mannose-6-phosphate isomerase [Muribaculaceae bacterium]
MEKMACAYFFQPYLKSVIWGGSRLPELKGASADNAIGESWELSPMEGHVSVVSIGAEAGTDLRELVNRHGARLLGDRVFARYGANFPLLVKFIDARQNLSVQVHPGDEHALREHGAQGKTEMWYVIDHEPNAEIYAGLTRPLAADDFENMATNGNIMDAVKTYPTHRGDAFFIPAGTVHSIGAGNFLLEVQQPSDITYRIYDFGRRDDKGRERELHLNHARKAVDFSAPLTAPIAYDRETDESVIVDCDFFSVRKVDVDGIRKISPADGSFIVAVCVAGECKFTIDGEDAHLPFGHSMLIPASSSAITAFGRGTLILINS